MGKFDYEMSEQAFITVWNKFNNPDEINDENKAYEFLKALVTETKGLFIVDHISGGNYDNVNSILYDDPYFIIQWKDFNKYRIKYLNNELNDDETLHWSVFGCATYDYLLFKFNKLKFKKIQNHLYIALQLQLTNIKEFEKWLKNKGYTKLSIDDTQDFEIDYVLYEGDKNNALKHICRVNNLPFYTNLLQPKERCCSPIYSTKALLAFTHEEIMYRLNEANKKLILCREKDLETLFDIGNRVRRIIEYFLKYFCVYNRIEMNVSQKYSFLSLGDLKKEINKKYGDIINQALINKANEFSHDSGKIFKKEDVEKLINEAKYLIERLKEINQNNL